MCMAEGRDEACNLQCEDKKDVHSVWEDMEDFFVWGKIF